MEQRKRTKAVAADMAPAFAAIGPRIREVRESKGMNCSQLAACAGLSQGYLWLVESGQRVPTLATIFILAKVLEIEPRELIPLVWVPRFVPAPPAEDVAADLESKTNTRPARKS